MSALPRARLLALLAAAGPVSDADPLLAHRVEGAAAYAAAEERLRKAAVRAFGQWTGLVRGAVLDGHGLTAAADEPPAGPPPAGAAPDPYAVTALSGAWNDIATATIVTAVDELLADAFAAHLLDGTAVSSRAWAESYLAEVSNRLTALPNETFDRVRTELQAGHDVGESIPQLRDRVAEVLSVRHGGDANFWRNRATLIARTECLPADTVIEGANVTAVYRRPYSGPWVTVETQDGRKLSGTPNHPVLTTRGWVGLGELTEADHLICDRTDVEGASAAGDEHVQGGPATLGEIFDALAAVAVPVRVAGGKPDFHGDGAEGYVEVLRPDGVLRLGRFTALEQRPQQIVLEQADLVASGATGLGDGFRRSLPVDEGFHLFTAAEWDALLAKPETDHLVIATESAAQVFDRPALTVERADEDRVYVVPVQRRGVLASGNPGEPVLPVAADTAPIPADHLRDRGSVDPELSGERQRPLPGRVTTDQVRLVDVDTFVGHVYNLTCIEGYFAAGQGVVTSNTTAAVNAGHLYARETVQKALAVAEGLDPDSPEALGDKVWISTLDTATREHHRELDGQRVPLDKPFTYGEPPEGIRFPGDPEAPPSATANCRCSVVFLRHDQELPHVTKRQMGQDTTPDSSGMSDPATPPLLAAPQDPTRDDPAGAPSIPPLSEGPPVPRTWRSNPFLAPFATPTGDGRIFKTGSLTNRSLPLPLLFQDSSAAGHDQSTVVGRITHVEFTDEGIIASGDFLDSPAVEATVGKAVALVEADLGHVSVDLAACTGELVDANGNQVSMEDIFDAWDRGEDPTVLEQVTSGELIACTMVATPAFGVGAKITLADLTTDATPGTPVGAEAAAVEGDVAASMVDSKGNPVLAGAVVDVVVEDPAGQAPADAAAPAAPADGSAQNTVRGRVTNVDAKASKITVQPEDETADPLVVDPQAVTVVAGGDDGTEEKPAPGKPAAPKPGAAAAGTETFDLADTLGDPTNPADDTETEPEPAAEEVADVAPVNGNADLSLLEQVAPHYDEAAKLVGDAFAGLADERVKKLAADLVEDAAEWRALLDYGLTPDDDMGLLASAADGEGIGPAAPAAEWFDNPNLAGPTPITVTDDGRVFGHAAIWGTCHVGFSNTCVTPPPSAASYAYFHTGEVVCGDGTRVAVGNLTLGGRHADVRAGYRSAIEHYDVRGAGVAVVRMYEDEHGIAFAGALTPGCTETQKYDLMRSPVSGDWRRVGGSLELIGVLSVNAPGFPTPRFATDEGGRTALTAAPSVRPTGRPVRTRGDGMSQSQIAAYIQAQIGKEVVAELGRQRAAEVRAKRLAAATLAVKGDPRERMAALAASVDGGRTAARRDRLTELATAVGA